MFAHVGSSGENRKSIVRQPTVRAVPEKKSIAVARQKIRAPISQDPFLLPGKRGQSYCGGAVDEGGFDVPVPLGFELGAEPVPVLLP